MKKKILKLIGFNIAFIVANIVLFSNWFLGIKLFSFFGIILAIASIITFFKTNNRILNGKKKEEIKKEENKLETAEDFRKELVLCMSKREFREEATRAVKQMERLTKKIQMLEEILAQHFSRGSLTYEKFNSTVVGVEKLFFDNLRKMITKIRIFDQDEYNNMARENRNLSTHAVEKRNAIYKEYIDYAGIIIEKNENLLIKLDDLTLEISKLADVEEANIEDLMVVQEINELIDQTKLYKRKLEE